MTLQEVDNVFKSVLPDATFHYFSAPDIDRYIIWAEDGQADASYADNKMAIQVIEGTTDLFTRMEFDTLVKQIQVAMNEAGIAWKLNSVQFEEQTGYIHYEWVWQVGDTVG